MNFPFILYLAVPDVMQAFIIFFSFAKLASIGFAGFTGTNGSICFHQVSYLKRFLSSSLYKDYSGSFQLKKKTKKQVSRYKFSIKPSSTYIVTVALIITITLIYTFMLVTEVLFNLILFSE